MSMSTSTLSQVDEKAIMQLSSWDSSGVCTHFPNKGEQKVRRRMKRARAEGAAGAEMKKRRLSEEQVRYLEMSFWKERKLESGRKAQLAIELGIDPKQVSVWFQNRRARSKSKQLEEEYAKLKSQHESTVLQKCHLEAEVLNLKEQLSEAQKEIRKLSGAPDGFSCGGNGGGGGEMSSSSPSTTSFSMDTTQAFHGGIGPEGEELVYINEYNTYVNMLDWMNLYGI